MVYKGISCSPGSVYGPVTLMISAYLDKETAKNVDDETNRLTQAVEYAKEKYDKLIQTSKDSEAEDILEAQKMLLSDACLLSKIKDVIYGEGCSCETAVLYCIDEQKKQFENLENAEFSDKTADFDDIADALFEGMGHNPLDVLPDTPSILVCREITPGMLLKADRSKILALVSEKGSAVSHAAILARAYNIPMISGVNIVSFRDGQLLYVDGDAGTADTKKPKPSIFKWNKKVKANPVKTTPAVLANVGTEEEAQAAAGVYAEGIGLLRSELFYLVRDALPSQDELVSFYRDILNAFSDGIVTIRLTDFGEDKIPNYLSIQEGERGIGFLISNPTLLKSQLAALQALPKERIRILLPMVKSVDEVLTVRNMMTSMNLSIPVGSMIETNEAIANMKDIVRVSDFVSVGTNDLQRGKVVERNNIPGLIAVIAKVAKETGTTVSVCGEMAADVSLTKSFRDMGVDELSVSPNKVALLHKTIQKL